MWAVGITGIIQKQATSVTYLYEKLITCWKKKFVQKIDERKWNKMYMYELINVHVWIIKVTGIQE
jgi:hypothetical protein